MGAPDRVCPDYPNDCMHPWAHGERPSVPTEDEQSDPYTDSADVVLVARALCPAKPHLARTDAQAVLAALAEAGRLQPAGGETRVQWSVRVTTTDGREYIPPGYGPYLDRAGAERAARYARRMQQVVAAGAVTRTTTTGPWLPVPTEGDA